MGWDFLGKLGKAALSFIPGGGAAVAVLEGVEAVATACGGDAGNKVSQGVAMVREGLQEMQPEKLTGEQQLAMRRECNRHEEAVRKAVLEEKRLELKADAVAAEQVTERAAKLEGTAEDLLSIPYVGPILLSLRGLQRIAWGFGTLVMDWMILSKQWVVPFHAPNGVSTLEGVLVVLINLLVLCFLFGERTLKKVLPLVIELLDKRTVKAKG